MRRTPGTAARSRTRHGRPGRDRSDARADGLDDAGALVPEHRRPAARRRGRRRRGGRPSGTRPPPRRARAPRPRAAGRASASRRAAACALVQDGGPDLHQATRCSSRRSRSGTTPEPGPGGGAIVPSARSRPWGRRAASRGGPASIPAGRAAPRGTGRSRRAAARCRFASEAEAVRPRVRRERAAAQVRERGDPPAAAEAAGEHHVGLHHVDAAAQDEVARLEQAAHHLARPRCAATCAGAAARSPRRRRVRSGSSSQ